MICAIPFLQFCLERCSQRTTDSQGVEGVVRAGLEDKGQKVSKQDIRVEQKVSVALLASRYDNDYDMICLMSVS